MGSTATAERRVTTAQEIPQSTGMVVHQSGGAIAKPAAPAFDMNTFLDMVSSPGALEQAKKLANAYDTVCRALVSDNDVQKEGDKEFKKKSAWRKLGRHFHISTHIREHTSYVDEAGHTISTVIVVGTAPWGQTMEAIGACSTRESRFGKPKQRAKADHDTLATAATRATNRVVSDLIAAGEVSAEEVELAGQGGTTQAADQDDGSDMKLEQALELEVNGFRLGDLKLERLRLAESWAEKKLEKDPDNAAYLKVFTAISLVLEQRELEAATAGAEVQVPQPVVQEAAAAAVQDPTAGAPASPSAPTSPPAESSGATESATATTPSSTPAASSTSTNGSTGSDSSESAPSASPSSSSTSTASTASTTAASSPTASTSATTSPSSTPRSTTEPADPYAVPEGDVSIAQLHQQLKTILAHEKITTARREKLHTEAMRHTGNTPEACSAMKRIIARALRDLDVPF